MLEIFLHILLWSVVGVGALLAFAAVLFLLLFLYIAWLGRHWN